MNLKQVGNKRSKSCVY